MLPVQAGSFCLLNAQLVRLRLLSIRACAKLTKTLRVRAYARTLGFDAAKIALGFAEARLCSHTKKPANRSLSSWYARKIYRKPKSRFPLSVTKRKTSPLSRGAFVCRAVEIRKSLFRFILRFDVKMCGDFAAIYADAAKMRLFAALMPFLRPCEIYCSR